MSALLFVQTSCSRLCVVALALLPALATLRALQPAQLHASAAAATLLPGAVLLAAALAAGRRVSCWCRA